MGIKKRLVITSFVCLVIGLSILLNQNFTKGKIKPIDDKIEVNNIHPIYPATDFHIWDDRLYYKKEHAILRHDISDKQDIAFVNELGLYYRSDYDSILGYYDSFVGYFENKLIVIDPFYVDGYNLTEVHIGKFDLSNDVFEEIQRTYAIVPYEVIWANAITDEFIEVASRLPDDNSGILNVSLVTLDDPGEVIPLENVRCINSFEHPNKNTILDGNYLYKISEISHEKRSLLIYDITNISSPVLLGNWTDTSTISSDISIQKVQNSIYLQTNIGEVYTLNVTDKLNPTKIGEYNFTDANALVRIHSHYAIVGRPYHYLKIYNISKLDSYTLIGDFNGTTDVDSQKFVNFVVFDEFIAYTYMTEAVLIDWSNPADIVVLEVPFPVEVGLNQFWIIVIILFSSYLLKKRKKRKC